MSPGPRPEGGWKRTRTALLLSLIPGMVGILLVRWAPTASLEATGLDLLFVMRGALPPPPAVLVVALDEDSYDVLGVSRNGPWPRALHAQLIRTLAREGAKAIAFDVLFEGAGEPDQDAALEQALRAAGSVVLGATVDVTVDPRFKLARVTDPYEPFARAAAAVAEVGFPLERDGVIRRTWLVHGERPSLAFAAFEVATRGSFPREQADRLIDHYGRARTVRTVPFYQALEPQEYLPPGLFKDAIVLVGLSQAPAPGPPPMDAFRTPFSILGGAPTYGVEIHATVAGNLLEGRRIVLLPGPLKAVLLLVLPLLASLVFIYLRPLLGGAAFFVLELLPWAAAYAAFSWFHVWIPVMIPAIVQVPGAYVLSLIWYYLTTARERERIRRAFSFYLSPEMIRRITADPSSLELGGEEIVGTALFTDIKGFTTIAETMRAPEAAALLNAYFSEVNDLIFREGGTLMKFIGDAVLALWGAPVHIEDHATPACRAALALASAQRDGAADEGSVMKRLVTRIGVHTGHMVVGNLGSEQRFDYTAIGDAVNLTSRLEGLNKVFGTLALVSGETLSRTGGAFAVRRLGRVRVVGKTEPVEIFELLGVKGEATRPGESAVSRFEDALDDFTARRFDEAARGFHEVLSLCDGEDGPSEFYLEAIEPLRLRTPPSDWDGVIDMQTK